MRVFYNSLQSSWFLILQVFDHFRAKSYWPSHSGLRLETDENLKLHPLRQAVKVSDTNCRKNNFTFESETVVFQIRRRKEKKKKMKADYGNSEQIWSIYLTMKSVRNGLIVSTCVLNKNKTNVNN